MAPPPRLRRWLESQKAERSPQAFHSHGSVRTTPPFGRPCVASWRRRSFCVETVGTNTVADHYFAPDATFVLCPGSVCRREVHSHKVHRHPCNTVTPSTVSAAPASGSRCFGHDRRTPSQPTGLYHDNKLSRSRACWTFFEIMMHFVECDDDDASLRWLWLAGVFIGAGF